MTMATEKRAARPPLQSVREAPFTLKRDSGDGEPNDGLTLDGYGAVFNRMTVIDSWEGRFREQIAPGAMKRSFRETPPIVQFDHGRHSMIGSIPIAELRSITEDTDPVLAPDGGAHVVARIFDNWLMAPVRDAIAAQAIKGMSFRFGVLREAWSTADGKPIRDDKQLMDLMAQCIYDNATDDELPIRTLKELKVPEIGPVVWPAYEQTSVSVRSIIDLGRLDDPEQRKLLARAVFIADKAESGVKVPVRAEGDDDPAALAAALDATLDQACMLIDGVDTTTLPPGIAQACNLIVAAETIADELLDAMGILNPDEDDATEGGRNTDVDAQQVTDKADERPTRKDDAQQSTAVGEHPSKPKSAQRITKSVVNQEMARMRGVLLSIDKKEL